MSNEYISEEREAEAKAKVCEALGVPENEIDGYLNDAVAFDMGFDTDDLGAPPAVSIWHQLGRAMSYHAKEAA